MTLYEYWDSTTKTEREHIQKLICRRKTYKTGNKTYRVLQSQSIGDRYVILLCWGGDDEYVVFTDLLMPGSIPSDGFTNTAHKGMSMFKGIVRDEIKRYSSSRN